MFRFLEDGALLTAPASAASAASTASEELTTPSIWSTLAMPLLLVGMLVLMYFIMIRPQKKREKEAKLMRDALAVGDEIVTIGGIAGVVVGVRDDSVVIESGADHNRMRIMKWAIQDITQMRDTSVVDEDKNDSKDSK